MRMAPPTRAPALVGGTAGRVIAAVVAVGSCVATWILQGRPDHPLLVLPIWALAMTATVAAFPGAARQGSGAGQHIQGGLWAALGAILLLAAAARLVGLDRVVPVFSGDEGTIAMDGKELLGPGPRSDVFGTGSNSSMHLGMLPAGIGPRLWSSPIGGARLLYGVIGTLAVAATAATAGLLGGSWAAIAAAALIALCPHHLYFSRSAQNVVLDSLFVTVGVLFLLAVLRSGSPRYACLAGAFSGLALYGYGGGRVMPVVLLMSLPVLFWRFRATRRRQLLIALGLVAGFLVAGGPNIRFAASHFADWNGRFNQTSVFAPAWHREELALRGSEASLLINQFRMGVIGLLSSPPTIEDFMGHPMIGPPVLPALGIVGLGWVLGRRRFAEGFLLALVVGGNLAGVALTLSTPQPQRASSLVPMLAILGGAAFAGFLGLLPERVGSAPVRPALGALLVGLFLARQVAGFPLDWDAYGEAGGRHAALSQSMSTLLAAPAFAGEKIYFHGAPHIYWAFPSIPYLLPGRQAVDVLEPPTSLPPGLHMWSEEYLANGRKWAKDLGIRHAIRLAHPAYPAQELGLVFRVTAEPEPPATPNAAPGVPGPAL